MRYVKMRMLLCLLIIAVIFTSCDLSDITLWRPQDGVWFCDELGIQLAFEKDQPCFIVINESKIKCSWENDRGSVYLHVFCAEREHPEHKYGDTMFYGECITLSQTQYVLKHVDSGEQYTFYRVGQGDGFPVSSQPGGQGDGQ